MNRIGFHYFPDDHHYQQSDLDTWLPRLKKLGTSWLVLDTPINRAIPEGFIQGMIEGGIDPILHVKSSPNETLSTRDTEVLFNVYARWGIKHIVLFDRPNLQVTWGGSSWSQSDLVESFLDIYISLGEASLKAGLTPIFPPLEPGGDYWDTSFLKAALEGIHRRGHNTLLNSLVLGAYAWADDLPLNYGEGGPERWPGVQPYITPEGEQDQRGLRIYDWYDSIVRSVLRESRPIFLFGLGNPSDNEKTFQTAQLLAGEEVEDLVPLPDVVLGGAFWLLSASRENQHLRRAWYLPDGKAAPIVDEMYRWQAPNSKSSSPTPEESHIISHYVLLPAYDWGIPDHHLDALRPYIKAHQPTLGFSLQEAAKAQRVTVIGSEEEFPEIALRHLRSKGCVVERVHTSSDGTTLASKLARLT